MKRGPASQRSNHVSGVLIIGQSKIGEGRTIGRRDDNRAPTRRAINTKWIIGRSVIGDKRERIGG